MVAPTAIAIFPTFVAAVVAVAMIPGAAIPMMVIAIMVLLITAIAAMVTRPLVVIVIAGQVLSASVESPRTQTHFSKSDAHQSTIRCSNLKKEIPAQTEDLPQLL